MVPLAIIQDQEKQKESEEKTVTTDDEIDDETAFGHFLIRIEHPEDDLIYFSSLLSIHCIRTWRAGEQRTTPIGRILPGVYKRSYWYSEHIEFSEKKGFSSTLANVINRLQKIQKEIEELKQTGGFIELYFQFPGSVNNGDTIPSSQLKILGELGVDLSLEVFPDMRND
jgi:hypothetical protein